MKKINFKQPKYIIPTIVYFGLLLLGYLFIDLFTTEVNKKESNMESTEYLNAKLPRAQVSNRIGSKRQNVIDMFGNISDHSAVQNVENDIDSLRKKEEYESKYTEEELKLLEEQEKQREEIKRLKEQNEDLRKSSGKGSGFSGNTLPMTEEERARALEMRRNGLFEEMERQLGSGRIRSGAGIQTGTEDSISSRIVQTEEVVVDTRAVHSPQETAKENVVVKKTRETSDCFNTICDNQKENRLITAIIDEELKAVDGSRVRLRLLDEIEIDGRTIPKGTCLYATMSGFSKQRVSGTVGSVLVEDEILKVNLRIYDAGDGLEGLYVPESQFRETAKEVGSSAMQNQMNIDTQSDGNVGQWAGQALKNAYQRASSALGKVIKKNRVRLKYGTHVYLVNGNRSRRSGR